MSGPCRDWAACQYSVSLYRSNGVWHIDDGPDLVDQPGVCAVLCAVCIVERLWLQCVCVCLLWLYFLLLRCVPCIFTCPHELCYLVCSIVWVVSVSSSEGLPTTLQQFINVLGLLVGDMSFLQPECTGLSSFLSVYTLNVSGTLCFICTTRCSHC